MDSPNTCTYTYQSQQRNPGNISLRSTGAYQNSSAFSASANPDEDWTKISDLAERRRIQNRIAQRNYRKKLKRRLEDLERRTTSSSASPEQTHQELVKPASPDFDAPVHQTLQRRVSASKPSISNQKQHYPSSLSSSEEAWMNQTSQIKSPFTYSTPSKYASPASRLPPVGHHQHDFNSTTYPRFPITYTNQTYSPKYAESMSPSLSSMTPSERFDSEQHYFNSDLMSPFSMNYASLAGLNMSQTHSMSDSASRTPPLTASSIDFDSKDYSPPQFAVPMTPEARPMTPNFALFDQIAV